MKVMFQALNDAKISKSFRKKVNISARNREMANCNEAEVLSHWKMLNFSHNFNWMVLNWDPECLTCVVVVVVEDFISHSNNVGGSEEEAINNNFPLLEKCCSIQLKIRKILISFLPFQPLYKIPLKANQM